MCNIVNFKRTNGFYDTIRQIWRIALVYNYNSSYLTNKFNSFKLCKTMKIERQLTDKVILAELGGRISRRRLDLELSQAKLAKQAGVSKRTVERVEAGASVEMLNMIRIFRVLDCLSVLDGLLPEAGPRPMDLLRFKGKERLRVSPSRKPESTDKWQWGEDV